MSLLYKLVHNVFLWLVPIIIVFYSISFALANGEMQKQAFRSGSFYEELSLQLQSDAANPANLDPKKGVVGLITSSVIGELATPEWIQNVIERNIDLTSDWFAGNENDWALYLPTEDINAALAKKLDDQTSGFLNQYRAEVSVCSDEQAQDIKKNGFDLSQAACLPKEVVSGKQSLTDFLAIKDDSFKDNFLGSLIKNSQFNTFSNQVKVSASNTIQNTVREKLNIVRDWSIAARKMIWVAVAGVLLLFIVDLILAKVANKTLTSEIQRVFIFTGISTIVLSITVMASLGGTLYLSSFLNQLILPGIATSSLVDILLWIIVRIIFNLVSFAIYIGLSIVAVGITLMFARRFGLIGNMKAKNEKLQKAPVLTTSNSTLDGQFREKLKSKVTLPPTEQFGAPTSPQNFDMPANAEPRSGFGLFNQDSIANLAPADSQPSAPIAPISTEPITRVTSTIDPRESEEDFFNPELGFQTSNFEAFPEISAPPAPPAPIAQTQNYSAPIIPHTSQVQEMHSIPEPTRANFVAPVQTHQTPPPAPVVLPTQQPRPSNPPHPTTLIDSVPTGPKVGGL